MPEAASVTEGLWDSSSAKVLDSKFLKARGLPRSNHKLLGEDPSHGLNGIRQNRRKTDCFRWDLQQSGSLIIH